MIQRHYCMLHCEVDPRMHFFINYIIQQGRIKLIKSDSKDMNCFMHIYRLYVNPISNIAGLLNFLFIKES